MVELLELFEGPLRDATFPDVSRDVLRALSADVESSVVERDHKATLVAEAEAVLADAEAAVTAARAALREADGTTAERQRALLARGQRALSYAKVFAETDPDLHARLSAISLARITQRGRPSGAREPRPANQVGAAETSSPTPRKRGRPSAAVAPPAPLAALAARGQAEGEPVELSASG